MKRDTADVNYLMLIWAEGRPAPEDLAVMQREIPGWVEEMDRRGVRLLGRELELPATAATVRVRDGETLVTDGPFLETKEFVAGFDLLDCADLDEAIEVAARTPVSWFQTVEIRPFRNALLLGDEAYAFGRGDDSAGRPYMLAMWTKATPAEDDDDALMREDESWRQEVQARGAHVLGDALDGPDTATTVRVRGGDTLLGDGPFTPTGEFIAGMDVVRCPDREQAVALAAGHPIARNHAIEVRPFYGE